MSKCNHRYLIYVNLKIILHHVVPLRQRCINSITSSHISNNGARKTNPNNPASLGLKGSSVCPVCYTHKATWKGRHASRRLSAWAVCEKIDRTQPFLQKAISKMFVLGKDMYCVFMQRTKIGCVFQLWKGKVSGNKIYSRFFPDIFLRDNRGTKVYIWGNFYKGITVMFNIHFIIPMGVHMKPWWDVCGHF